MRVHPLFGRIALSTLFAFTVALANAAHAAVLQVSGGELTGATGVNVNGSLYDVRFVEGTCVSLFSGCNDVGFTFHTSTDAVAASQALLDQVFLDSSSGNFGTQPSLTFGCENPGTCNVATPIFLGPFNLIEVGFASNTDATGDSAFVTRFEATRDTGGSDSALVWAVWTVSSSVPEPATLALFGIALAGLGFGRRKGR
jgi:PEP-CTERM motif